MAIASDVCRGVIRVGEYTEVAVSACRRVVEVIYDDAGVVYGKRFCFESEGNALGEGMEIWIAITVVFSRIREDQERLRSVVW